MRSAWQPNSLAICSSVFLLAKRLNSFFWCRDSLLSGGSVCWCKLASPPSISALRSGSTATAGKLLSSPVGINVAPTLRRPVHAHRWVRESHRLVGTTAPRPNRVVDFLFHLAKAAILSTGSVHSQTPLSKFTLAWSPFSPRGTRQTILAHRGDLPLTPGGP